MRGQKISEKNFAQKMQKPRFDVRFAPKATELLCRIEMS